MSPSYCCENQRGCRLCAAQGADQRRSRKNWWRPTTNGSAAALAFVNGTIAEAGTASFAPSQLKAAKLLLDKTKTDPAEIDLDYRSQRHARHVLFPRLLVWCKTAWEPNAPGVFDLSAACSGFAYALTVGAQFRRLQCAPKSGRDRKRCNEFDFGLQGPRHLRPIWRRCWGPSSLSRPKDGEGHSGFFA